MADEIPRWLAVLSEEDLLLLKRFLLNSGSLKALASDCGVSYPTIRSRLDGLIAKVSSTDSPEVEDAFVRLLDMLVESGVMAPGTARSLRQTHRRVVLEATQRAERHAAANLAQPAP